MKIDPKRLAELEKIERTMQALEAGGVDNWEWYSESLEPIRREERTEEIIEEILHALSEGAYEPSERGAGFAFSQEAELNATKILREYAEEIRNEHE